MKRRRERTRMRAMVGVVRVPGLLVVLLLAGWMKGIMAMMRVERFWKMG